MTVRFKTEYQRSFGVSRSRSASPQHHVPLTGLSSDQMGISRSPCLQKRRTLSNHHQTITTTHDAVKPSSDDPPVDPVESGPDPEHGPAANPEPGLDLDKARPLQPDSQSQPSNPVTAAADGQQSSANEVNHALRWKAGLRSRCQRSGGQRSEYRRQFSWKKPAEAAGPILRAEQVHHFSSRSVPPFTKNPVTMETEYQRSFQGLFQPTGPRLRKHLAHQRIPLFYTQGNKMRREESETKPRPIQEDPANQKENVSSQSWTKMAMTPPPPPPQRVQHRIQEGGETPDKDTPQVSEPAAQSRSWLNELRELRLSAASYRRRAWGTNFSRDHLSQLLSQHNALWELEPDPPTPRLTFDLCQESSSSSCVEALDLHSHSSISSKGNGQSAAAPPAQTILAWGEGEGGGGGGGGEEEERGEEGGGETDE